MNAVSVSQPQERANEVFAEGERLSGLGTKASREAAIKKFEEALALYQAAGNESAEAKTLRRLGNLYDELGELRKALDYYNQALPLWRSVGDRREEAAVLKSIGSVFEGLSERAKALESYSQALILFRAVGDKGAEAVTLSGMGVVYRLLGEPQKALDYYNQALLLHRAAGDKGGEAHTLQNIGVVYKVTNEMQKALEYFDQALLVSREIKDQQLEAVTLANMSDVYRILVQPEKALDYSNQALPLWRTLGDKRGEAMTLRIMGSTYLTSGEFQKSLEYYTQVLPLERTVEDRFGEALTLMSMGDAHLGLDDPQKALEYYNQSLPLMRSVGNREAQGALLRVLGDAYRHLGDLPKALAYYDQALPLQHAENARMGEANTLERIATVERDQGKLDDARATIERAITLLEFIRAHAGSQENRVSFLAAVSLFHEFYIDLLMQMHAAHPQGDEHLAALTVSEQSRARSLLEVLTEADADIRQGVDVRLLERERALKDDINVHLDGLTKLLRGKYSDAQKSAAEHEIDALTDAYHQVQAEIRERSPRYAALTQPHTLNAGEIQQMLDGDTVLLEYALGTDRSYLWLVTTDRVLSYQLPPRAEIEVLAKSVYRLLVARQPATGLTEPQQSAREATADAQYLTQATALSQMLLSPVAAQLGTHRLLIVADGALQYLPFAALPVPNGVAKGDGRGNVAARNNSNDLHTMPPSHRPPAAFTPLISGHEIVSLPSASVLAVLRRELADRQPPVRMVAVLADPVFSKDDARVKINHAARKSSGTQEQTAATGTPAFDPSSTLGRAIRSVSGDDERVGLRRLLFSRDEAEAIMSVTPQPSGLEALDFQANRRLAMSDELGKYRVVHFATHGLLDSQNPERSGLVLSLVNEAGQPQEGFLRLHEIYNLRLNADLVVLSACQTALGKEVRGEGLIGLTRGFMYAGAPRVMASLWQVDDAATAELMKRFYRGMMQEKLPPAAALRAAQLEVMKKKHWQSPYYWGAFILQGEWK